MSRRHRPGGRRRPGHITGGDDRDKIGGDVCTGLWQHVAGTYDGAIIRAYVNGAEFGTADTSGDVIDNANNATHIGADSGSPDLLEFIGKIDDLRLFDEALPPEELGAGTSLLLCGELTGECALTASDALAALRMAVRLSEVDPRPTWTITRRSARAMHCESCAWRWARTST